MDDFLKVFTSIDVDRSGEISMRELKTYIYDNDLDPKMYETWRKLFDKDHNSRISFEEFTRTLGIKQNLYGDTIVPITTTGVRSGIRMNKKLGDDVEVITATLPIDDQIMITDKVRELARPRDSHKTDERMLAGELKKFLDSEYSRMWHVVILTGSYWMNYSHEPSYSFQFRMGRYVYLIWRTPAN